jgi:hypothetical protein
LAVGAGINGRWLDIQGLPVGKALAFTTGVVVTPARDITFGVVWKNLNEPRISGYRDRIRESLNVGVAAQVSPNGWLMADIVQEKYFPLEYRIGAEALLLKALRLRVGARAEPLRPSAGFQVDAGRWSFSYAGDLHPDLGPSHQVSLEFRLHK